MTHRIQQKNTQPFEIDYLKYGDTPEGPTGTSSGKLNIPYVYSSSRNDFELSSQK